MSWQPLSNNSAFVPNQDYSQMPLDFNATANWGTQAPAGFDINSITDPWQRFQAESILKNQDLQGRQLGLAEQASQPMGGFAQGAQTFGAVADGLANLYSIYGGMKSMKLQEKAFKFNKGVTNTNLNNSIMDYNRRLSDTLQNRALNNGQGSGWVSEQLAKYSATRSG